MKAVTDAAKAHGIETDICGQAAEIPELAPLWAAMGIDNLSVSIPYALKLKKIICETDSRMACNTLQTVLSMDTAEEVCAYLQNEKNSD
jgi:phosphotransferase system enzyme I (PtsI)